MMVTGATAGGGVDHRGAARDVPARQDWAVEAEGYTSTVYGAAAARLPAAGAGRRLTVPFLPGQPVAG